MSARILVSSTLLSVLFILILGIGYALYFLDTHDFSKDAEAPPRPKDVPERAVWAGGIKGGNFFLCDANAESAVNHCTIYADYTGIVVADANFRIMGENRAASSDELNYQSFNGQVIHLKNGKYLVPEKPIIMDIPESK